VSLVPNFVPLSWSAS